MMVYSFVLIKLLFYNGTESVVRTLLKINTTTTEYNTTTEDKNYCRYIFYPLAKSVEQIGSSGSFLNLTQIK